MSTTTTRTSTDRFAKRVAKADWSAVTTEVNDYGCALLPELLTPAECRKIIVDSLVGLAVQGQRLGGAQGLPGFDGLAQQRVHRLGEGGAGLVDGDVEQADGILGEDVAGVAGDRLALVLAADAAEP
jgi:hypothetical protein